MSTSSKFIRLALLAVPLLGSAVPATANVRSANSSTVCQWETEFARSQVRKSTDAMGNEYIDGLQTARYSPQSGMFHTGPDDDGATIHPVTCNIPRNLPLRTDGMSDLEVRFRNASTKTGTRNITCTAYSYRSDGSLAAAATRTVTVDMASTDAQPLDFGGAINASASKGYYVLTCNMPGFVGLHSIYSSENDGVSGN